MILKNFPKIRPDLPEEFKEIYETHYKSNRAGQTLASSMTKMMESWMHKQVAADLINLSEPGTIRTLEIGAGTLNHLEYEPHVGPYDIVEPFEALYKDSPFLKRLRHIFSDISEVPDNYKYDRIISIATFEHICDLPKVVAKCGLLLTTGGALRVAIPNEGSLLWKLGWKLTTGLEFKIKYGLDYGLLMKHEHVNTAQEIEEVLKYFFRDIRCKVLGLTKYISLYRFYECKNPQIENCKEYLGNF